MEVGLKTGLKAGYMYDLLIQCGRCNREIDHFLTREKPEVGQETVRGVCHRCSQGDEAGVITAIDVDRIFSGEEDLAEWREENPSLVSDLSPDQIQDPYLEVVSVTAWALPVSLYPERDWLTVKEVAEQLGMSKDTLWTKIKRGELHQMQARGYIQPAGSVTLIHRQVIEAIREKLKFREMAP